MGVLPAPLVGAQLTAYGLGKTPHKRLLFLLRNSVYVVDLFVFVHCILLSCRNWDSFPLAGKHLRYCVTNLHGMLFVSTLFYFQVFGVNLYAQLPNMPLILTEGHLIVI